VEATIATSTLLTPSFGTALGFPARCPPSHSSGGAGSTFLDPEAAIFERMYLCTVLTSRRRYERHAV
jgi:hypothetical protein